MLDFYPVWHNEAPMFCTRYTNERVKKNKKKGHRPSSPWPFPERPKPIQGFLLFIRTDGKGEKKGKGEGEEEEKKKRREREKEEGWRWLVQRAEAAGGSRRSGIRYPPPLLPSLFLLVFLFFTFCSSWIRTWLFFSERKEDGCAYCIGRYIGTDRYFWYIGQYWPILWRFFTILIPLPIHVKISARLGPITVCISRYKSVSADTLNHDYVSISFRAHYCSYVSVEKARKSWPLFCNESFLHKEKHKK